MKEDKTIKFERRGKYPGVKIHLDREECEKVLSGDKQVRKAVFKDITEQLHEHIKKDPTLLEERTEEEIKATLMKEFVESEKKLAHIKDGLDWKKVKVEVQK